MYFHRETADDGTDYYYLTVPIDNLLFNMNSGDYENYADYLTSEAHGLLMQQNKELVLVKIY